MTPQNSPKRKTFKALLGAGAAVTLLPGQWKKPVVDAVLLPAHAQTSTDPGNQPPVGQNFTVDALADSSLIITLGSRVSDPDGDPLTINIVGSGVLSGGLTISSATVSGPLQISVSVSNGTGDIYIDYTVSDGTATSPVYRITVTNLDGPTA